MADILVDYKADTGDLIGKLKGVEQANNSVQTSAQKSTKEIIVQYQKQAGIIETIKKRIEALTAAREKDSNVDRIQRFNKLIEDQQNRIKSLTASTESALQKTATKTTSIFSGIAAGLGAAFAADKIFKFLEESNIAFQKAEAQANKLKFALENITKDGGAYDDLIQQSKTLAATPLFGAGNIQEAQALQAEFGLTAEEIKKLTPLIAELAVKQKTDLVTATNTALRAIEGQTKGLSTAGASFKDTGNSIDNYNMLIDKLGKLQGTAADYLETTEGKVRAQRVAIDDLQEAIGARLSPKIEGLKSLLLDLADAGLNALDDLGDGFQGFFNFIDGFATGGVTGAVSRITGNTATSINKLVEAAKAANEKLVADYNAAFGKLNISELEKKLDTVENLLSDAKERRRNATDGISKNLADQSITDLASQAIALNGLIRLRNAGIEAEKNYTTQVIGFSKERLKAEIAELQGRTQTSDVQALIEVRQKALEKLQKIEDAAAKKLQTQRDNNSEKLAERARKDAQDAEEFDEQNKVNRLKEKQKNDEDDARLTFSKSNKTKIDAENLQKDLLAISEKYAGLIVAAQAVIDTKLQAERDKRAALDKKNLEEDLKATLAVQDLVASEQKKFLIESYNEKGDFSKKAQKELANDLAKIELFAELAKNAEVLKSTVSTEEDKLKATKDSTDAQIKFIKTIGDQAKLTKEETLKAILELVEDTSQVLDGFFDLQSARRESELQDVENKKQSELDIFDQQLQDLEDLNERKGISDRVYEMKRKALLEERVKAEKKSDAELKKLKREQAEQDKLKAIFDSIINTAVAVTKFLSTGNIALSIAAGVTGALELATIIATPIPKFFKGTSFVERGNNPRGRDTIPAYLNEGERIFSTDKNEKNWDLFEAIENNRFKEFAHKKYILPALLEYKRNSENTKRKEMASAMGVGLVAAYAGVTPYMAEKMRKKGVRINNTGELGQVIGQAVSDALPKQKLAW